jgi:hypothetical protein
VERAKDTLEHDEGWTLSQSLFGVTTYYRREPDNSLSLKLNGELVGAPLFEQVAVLREVDLHYKWSPFCTSSMTLANIDKLDTVGWAVVGLPQFGLARDGCFRAFGCDDLQESASFYIVGQGVEDRNPMEIPYDEEYFLQGMEGIQIPAAPTRLGSGRITVQGLFGCGACLVAYASANTDCQQYQSQSSLYSAVVVGLCHEENVWRCAGEIATCCQEGCSRSYL